MVQDEGGGGEEAAESFRGVSGGGGEAVQSEVRKKNRNLLF